MPVIQARFYTHFRKVEAGSIFSARVIPTLPVKRDNLLLRRTIVNRTKTLLVKRGRYTGFLYVP